MANNALLITTDVFYKNMLDYQRTLSLYQGTNFFVFCSSFEILGKIVTNRKVMTLANPCKTREENISICVRPN